MKPLLILLTLLCVACVSCDTGTHEPLIITNIISPITYGCDGGFDYEITINEKIFIHTDSLYRIGDTLKLIK